MSASGPTEAAGARSTAERLGHPGARLLVIHADDFGMSHAVNRATMRAFEERWITSASAMAVCPWFAQAARFAREHPEADVGLHLTLNSEWTDFKWGPAAPRDRVPSLVDGSGHLWPVERNVVEQGSASEVEIEIAAQVDQAIRAGIRASHFDSHMGTLLHHPEFYAAYLSLAQRHGVPVRGGAPAGAEDDRAVPTLASLVDEVHEIDPSVPPERWRSWYEAKLAALSPGVHQVTVHLAFDDEEMRGVAGAQANWGAAWRQRDLDLVSDPEFRRFLEDQRFVLVSWRDLARALA